MPYYDATHIIATLIGFFGIFVTALFGYLTHKHTREINDAVNHRHEKRGQDAPKLYDLIWENHEKVQELIEWKRTYDGGPLSTGPQVDAFVNGVTSRLNKLEEPDKPTTEKE